MHFLSLSYLTWRQRDSDRIPNSFIIWSALAQNMPNQTQQKFSHVITVLLLWRVQTFIVIGRTCYEQEHFEVSLNFEFDWNTVGGAGAGPSQCWDIIYQHWNGPCSLFFVCFSLNTGSGNGFFIATTAEVVMVHTIVLQLNKDCLDQLHATFMFIFWALIFIYTK